MLEDIFLKKNNYPLNLYIYNLIVISQLSFKLKFEGLTNKLKFSIAESNTSVH